ncbi:DUF3990 domain-containing protein [Pseudobutyrivibrio xylanivorans]|uniref:DUF3990 domain-containing protein n=1 Tax=Pseudobutyrivibrio xylanivorans DSM 14809 TaxID=1123012 RepID=A0A1M6AF24_PSEXY|nr:DUF3990 domain-containing protein [Pseudobutyrivibrio xylanivorans]SHI35001.1 Protein of unknown function [Pseudobutyrivibrio xylanivorans DSM 14809]
MNKITLYHGSDKIISEPKINLGKKYNDYGQGLYCTRHLELAKEWAVDEGRDGFVNIYELDIKGLKVLDLNSEDYSILHWLTVLLEHRVLNVNAPVAIEGMEYLKRHYHISLDDYDVVLGYRADDSYFSFARAFISNSISIAQLEKAMYLGNLGTQYFIKSKNAFSKLNFIEALPVDSTEFFSKKNQRDTKARADYEKITNAMDRDGVYILDLIRKEK